MRAAAITRRPPIAVLATAAIVTLGGCVGDDVEAVRGVADRFYAAVDSRQGARACRQLAEPTRRELEKTARKPCARAVLELDLPRARPIAARVYESSASVDLSGGQTAFLDRRDEGWRIAAVGCRPQLEQPYDCELES